MKTYSTIIGRFGLVLIVLRATDAMAAESQTGTPQDAFTSPIAVFNACRQAEAAGNWRAAFRCYTPERQDEEVFEALIACETTAHYREAIAIRQKYGVDDAKLNSEYQKTQNNKPGTAAASSPNSERDERKSSAAEKPSIRVIVAAIVKDKAGLFSEVNSLTNHQTKLSIGELKLLSVTGDIANGQAGVTIVHHETVPGKPSRSVATVVDKLIYFRRINGQWFVDVERPPPVGNPIPPRIDIKPNARK